MYHFQVPAGWELPENFVPPIGWKPKDYWVSAPDDWLFWRLDESYSRPYVLEMYENKHGKAFADKWRATSLQRDYKVYLIEHKKLTKHILKASTQRVLLTKANSPIVYQKLPIEAKVEKLLLKIRYMYLSRVLWSRSVLDKQYATWVESNQWYDYEKRSERQAKTKLANMKNISENPNPGNK